MSLQHHVIATMLRGVEKSQQLMKKMQITEEDIHWFALVTEAMQFGQCEELKTPRYIRVNAFLSVRVFPAHPMLIRELVFSKCHCGQQIVGFEAVKQYAAKRTPRCTHLTQLISIMRIIAEARAEIFSPPKEVNSDGLILLLDQLFEAGMIATFNIHIDGDPNAFQALLSTEGIRFLRQIDDILESKLTVF